MVRQETMINSINTPGLHKHQGRRSGRWTDDGETLQVGEIQINLPRTRNGCSGFPGTVTEAGNLGFVKAWPKA